MRQSVSSKAWDFLTKRIKPDIALLQEAVPPATFRNRFCLWQEIGGTRRWGSAVLTKKLPVSARTLARNDHPGALVVADVQLPDNSTLVAISMYGQLDHSYAITTLHRMLSDLTPLFHGKHHNGKQPMIILGGDLNASVQIDAQQGDRSHRIFFERLEDFGLVDCQGPFNADRPRTLRHTKSKVSWVNDYIYVSERLAEQIVAAQVMETPEMLSLSDHNPVVVSFDL